MRDALDRVGVAMFVAAIYALSMAMVVADAINEGVRRLREADSQ